MIDRLVIAKFQCPFCDALPGKRCVAGTRTVSAPHNARRKLGSYDPIRERLVIKLGVARVAQEDATTASALSHAINRKMAILADDLVADESTEELTEIDWRWTR